jgi:predicted dithiol-disulfide oxidoreductase (DUF899 family)
MGESCSYCMLWADGFNGYAEHMINRCAFVLVNNDPIDQLIKYAQSRSWSFPFYSAKGSDFSKDMDFFNTMFSKEPDYLPGVLAFTKDKDNNMFMVNKSLFGPGDLYSSFWHMLDLLPNSKGEWEPQKSYQKA